jgi:hypothetical protein
MLWFRMYGEFATDPKVQSMDETLQRRFTMFLCLHCSGEYDRLSDEELACALRITPEELAGTKEVFRSKGFIDPDGKIRNWNKRQYKSDDVYSRVKKHREEKKKRRGNVSVTPSESDTDTESERTKRVPSEPVPLKRDDVIGRVFDHWRKAHRHPRAQLDAKRRKLIESALKLYSEADLCLAITGYLNSPHHMGQNERGMVYDDIGLFLRDGAHIDAGLKHHAEPARQDLSALTRRNVAATEDWVPPEMRRAAN